MSEDWIDWMLGALLVLAGALLAVSAVEITQDYRSFDGRVACEARRMTPRRQFLSSEVVCVPAIMRNDTTTVDLR